MRILHSFTMEELNRISPHHRRITDAEKDKRNKIRTEICIQINAGVYDDSWLTKKTIKGNSVIAPTTPEISIVYTKIYKDLSRIYKIKQADRTQIIKQVVGLCKDENKGYISKADIQSFYESIPAIEQLEKMNSDGRIGVITYNFLQWTIKKCAELGVSGLPRGISFSPVFAELYLRNFDRSMIENDSVYYYARFVDDILIFHTKDFVDFETFVNGQLPGNLNLKSAKTVANIATPLVGEIQYLGYKIRQIDDRIFVQLADSKEEKFKRKILASIICYKIEKRPRLLEKRIRFITANYPRKYRRNGDLLAGIYYNYPMLSPGALKQIDSFLHEKINSIIDWAQKHTPDKVEALNKIKRYSFSMGWEKRIVYKLSLASITDIRKAWRYE